MIKITDDFLEKLLEDTKAKKVKWYFLHTWDVFTAEYDGKTVKFEHTVEKSLQYDSLTMAVTDDKDFGICSGTLNIDIRGKITPNPRYDLLLAIKKAAIDNKSFFDQMPTPKLTSNLTLKNGLIEQFIKDTWNGKMTWKQCGEMYVFKSEEFSVIFVERNIFFSDDKKISITVRAANKGHDIEDFYADDKGWEIANILRCAIKVSIYNQSIKKEQYMVVLNCPLVLNSALLECLAGETKTGKLKWSPTQKGYIYKSEAFCCSLNVDEDGLIMIMFYVVGEHTNMELYTPYDKDWEIANTLKDAIFSKCHQMKNEE